jgi:hypothetical protein
MIRTTSFATVVAAVAMSPLIGFAQPAAAPAAGSDVRPRSRPGPGSCIDLPPKLVCQCEGKQTSSGAEWTPLLVAILGVVGTLGDGLGGVWLTGRLNARYTREIESLKKGFEFRLSSDRTVLEKRMHHYERLLAVLQKFPKYPEPRSLRVAELKLIAIMLQDLYFGGAGIYMSEEVRDGYFDLQDGIRIVLGKANQIKLSLSDPEGEVNLREVLDRGKEWTIPAEITALCDLTSIEESLQLEVLESIRKLGSRLRTRMAADLDSRRELSDRGAQQPGNARTRSG